MSNKLTLSQIKEIINIYLEEGRNFLMVVNKPLAIYISEYLDEEYDIVDEEEDLDNEEFYVSLWFDENKIKFYIESAKGKNHYKEVETFNDQFIDYFIQEDIMSEEEVDKYLLGEATWSWFEIVDENEEANGFAHNCTNAINETLEMFDNPNTCDECKFKALMNLIILGVDGALQGCITNKKD